MINPNTADAHAQSCFLLGETGRLDEAWREFQIAQELDPNNDHLSQILYERGDYDRAIVTRRMMIERHADDGSLHYGLSQFYAQKGMYKESVEELEKTLMLYGLRELADKIHRAFAAFGYRGAIQQFAKEGEHLHATKAAQAKVKIQSTLQTPRCRSLRMSAIVFSQPKHSSIRFLFL